MRQSLDTYLKVYNKQKQNTQTYTNKFYNKKLSKGDKKNIRSKFAFNQGNFTLKDGLFTFIFIIVMLLFGHFVDENNTYMTYIIFIILFFIIAIGFYENVKSKYYIIILVSIILVVCISSGLHTKTFSMIKDKINTQK